ncbi:hypothetical protein Nepgr_023522 [Nepenthes gracilis]|uniref:Uncharacterized protein n=1 Tax=Nepenthes gracilis TaxID=150966 RepID=A0AAD3T1E0_NEPGR|nr:hypothetical protein Nepgr_023522 [Nepenthes gracilis]
MRKPAKNPRRFANSQILESSRAPSQTRLEERSRNMSPEESLEWRNPRYSQAEIKNPIQEETSRTVRSTGGSSRPTTSHSKEGTELRPVSTPRD